MACTATPVGAACETDMCIIIFFAANHTLHCWCVVIEGHAQATEAAVKTAQRANDKTKKQSIRQIMLELTHNSAPPSDEQPGMIHAGNGQ